MDNRQTARAQFRICRGSWQWESDKGNVGLCDHQEAIRCLIVILESKCQLVHSFQFDIRDISDGKGFASAIYRVALTIADGNQLEYSFVMKVPTAHKGRHIVKDVSADAIPAFLQEVVQLVLLSEND